MHHEGAQRDGDGRRAIWCTVCAAVGQPERARSHNTGMCYLNPTSQFFRHGLWRHRVIELTKAGKPVPKELHRDGYVNGESVG